MNVSSPPTDGKRTRTDEVARMSESADRAEGGLLRTGEFVFRYGLVLIFLWAGALKFTAYEAKNIEPMVSNSPIWSWAYQALGLQSLSNVIGVMEITIGLLIATRPIWPKLSAIGCFGSIATFVITLSFMLTTPGVWEPGYGFPALSGMPGNFLPKISCCLEFRSGWQVRRWQQQAGPIIGVARPHRVTLRAMCASDLNAVASEGVGGDRRAGDTSSARRPAADHRRRRAGGSGDVRTGTLVYSPVRRRANGTSIHPAPLHTG